MFKPAQIVMSVLVALTIFFPVKSFAEGRYALIIGNSAYKSVAPLKNPRADAELMSRTLTEVGFEVILVTDADRTKMGQAMLQFSRKLRNNPGSVGLFYYAGHGVQVSGVNYMIPVTANITHEDEIRFEGIDINEFLETMRSSGSRLNIIILDACRNNPFPVSSRSASRGLAQVEATSGTLIAYSTAPGKVAFDGGGVNSPYTLALARYIRKPGLSVETVFKRVLASVEDETGKEQTPWLNSAFRGEFYFVKKKPGAGATSSQSTSSPSTMTDKSSAEKLFWQSILNSTNPASYKAYLATYPNGIFATLAKIKISELENASNNTVVASRSTGRNSPDGQQDDNGAFPELVPAKPVRQPRQEQKTNTLSYRYVFPDSATRQLRRSEVEPLSCHKLWLARNEIYYRKGYCFKTEKGIRYFDNSNCTSSRVRLTALESRNQRTIRAWEIRKRCRLKRAINKLPRKRSSLQRRPATGTRYNTRPGTFQRTGFGNRQSPATFRRAPSGFNPQRRR